MQIDCEGNSDKTGDSILPPPYSPPSQPSVYDPNAADELNDWDERNNWDVNTGVCNFSEIYISALFTPCSRNCFLQSQSWTFFFSENLEQQHIVFTHQQHHSKHTHQYIRPAMCKHVVLLTAYTGDKSTGNNLSGNGPYFPPKIPTLNPCLICVVPYAVSWY